MSTNTFISGKNGTIFGYGSMKLTPTIAIINYTNAVKTTADGNTIYTFTNTSSTGTFSVSGNVNAHILIIGGGGAGGSDGGGGGGAGGLLDIASVPLTTKTYNINTGIGALGSNASYNALSNGSNTTFDTLYTAYGGCGGYPLHSNIATINTGGSGGGASCQVGTGVVGPGLGTPGQGYNGGPSGSPAYNAGAGGGGATQIGYINSDVVGGAGGNGYTSNISGTSQTYAGGGGGGCWNGTGGTGGLGGGGTGGGAQYGPPPGSGSYYGAGGGGNGYGTFTAGSGYQGIVIISIPTVNIANP